LPSGGKALNSRVGQYPTKFKFIRPLQQTDCPQAPTAATNIGEAIANALNRLVLMDIGDRYLGCDLKKIYNPNCF
jgi:hypothetical protein